MSARSALEQSIGYYRSAFGLRDSVDLYRISNLAYAYDFGFLGFQALVAWGCTELVDGSVEKALFNNWLVGLPGR